VIRPLFRSRAIRQGAAAVVLCLITFALFGADIRFVPVQTGLIDNLDFARGFAGWSGVGAELRARDDGGRELRLVRSAKEPPALAVRQVLEPGRFSHIRVSAEMRTTGIETGRGRWQRAGLVMPSYGTRGERLGYWPSEIALIGKDRPWARYGRVLPVSDEIASMRLFAYVGGPAGMLAIRDLAIDGMAEASWAAPARWSLFLAWGALAAWVLAALLVPGRPLGWPLARLLGIALGVVIVVLALYPQPGLSRLVRPVNTVFFGIVEFLPTRDDVAAALSTVIGESGLDLSQREPPGGSEGSRPAGKERRAPEASPSEAGASEAGAPEAGPTMAPGGRSAMGQAPGPARETGRLGQLFPDWLGPEDRGHIAAFALLAFAIRIGFRWTPSLAILAALLILGASIEALQTFSPTRDAEFSDLASDLLGILVGLAAATLFFRLARPRQGNQEKSTR